MNLTPIADATILHFCHYCMQSVPANLTFFIKRQLILQHVTSYYS